MPSMCGGHCHCGLTPFRALCTSTYGVVLPSGMWTLVLAHPVAAAIARRLLIAYKQQVRRKNQQPLVYQHSLCSLPSLATAPDQARCTTLTGERWAAAAGFASISLWSQHFDKGSTYVRFRPGVGNFACAVALLLLWLRCVPFILPCVCHSSCPSLSTHSLSCLP